MIDMFLFRHVNQEGDLLRGTSTLGGEAGIFGKQGILKKTAKEGLYIGRIPIVLDFVSSSL